jgi:hypothetical protein
VDNQIFKVTLEFTGDVPMGAWTQMPRTPQELETVGKIKQCLDIMFKHAMTANCIAVGKHPNTFFLKEYDQKQLILKPGGGRPVFQRYYVSEVLHSYFSSFCLPCQTNALAGMVSPEKASPTSYAPFIGISQVARFTQQGKFIFAVNNKVEWLYRSSHEDPRSDAKYNIPLLDAQNCTLAGVKIPTGSTDRKIEDPELRRKIEDAFTKLTFKVLYIKGPKWELSK